MPDEPRCIVIPQDALDDVEEMDIDLADGGYASLWLALDGEPVEVTMPAWLPLGGRTDLVAFVREDGQRRDLPRNTRATRLLAAGLPSGGWVAGDAVICCQQEDGGLVGLPPDVTLDSLVTALES